jgi:hypothetical protein
MAAIKDTKGIPSVPDVPPQLKIEDIYRILEPLTRIISIRQGKFDPLDAWITAQDLVDLDITTEGAVNSPVPIVPPTALNLPRVTCVDGGNATSTYPESTGLIGASTFP